MRSPQNEVGMNQNISHEVVWNREKVSRFWEYYSTFEAIEDNYFSKQVGDTVIGFVKKHIQLAGNILDYGCGPGFLIEKLLKERLACWGLDAVESNVKIIETKFDGNPYFKGAYYADTLPTSIPDHQFDVVFLIETIEHLLQDDLQAILKEIHRITKPGGKLVITTRNNENLDASKIICPDCGCIFHLMQHVSSWTTDSMSNQMAVLGFKEIVCTTTTFRPRTLWGYYKNITDAITRHPTQNLIYIGKKI
jgi:2-polyprenyl-3-methyl-5-hydroxy-6-metoxy-1,4-benzoquinol methylase